MSVFDIAPYVHGYEQGKGGEHCLEYMACIPAVSYV